MLTKTMRRVALLASLAVVCATLSAVPNATAVASKVPNTGATGSAYTAPSNAASYNACPGSSAAAAGFTDTTSAAVDCIKMFGITQGATATTYDPTGNIPRWQMALFLSRMYTPIGLAAGATAFTAFTDISGYSTEIQTAINAIAASGITVGTATGVFSPDDNVTREQMALFLYRMGNITKPYDSAVATTRGIWHDTIATDAGTGTYNYSDIANTSFEGMEAIISLYNAGVTGETCIATTVATCGTTYRPTDDITRAEMASMLHAQLNHTNARPAGVSIQSPDSLATVGSKTTKISVRNADFTPSANTLVDEFYQGHLDGTAAVPVAAQTPFTALGTCTAAVSKTVGTLCTIDAGDKVTNTLGNVAGTAQTAASNKTLNWWVWTGTTGTAYVDGVATVYTLSAPLGTAAAATEYASAASTMTISGTGTLGYALGTAGAAATGDFNTYNSALTGNNGVLTRAGNSRTITVQMKGANYALGATVVDGYTLKFADRKVDMLGNVNTTNTYVTSSGGTASYTVTCGADNNAAATSTGIGSANGSNGLPSYWEAHEVTITEATAAGTAAGVSRPASAGAVTFAYSGNGQHNSTMNISCDDAVSTHTAAATSASLTTSANNYPTATAGALMSITATAFDQYGVGMAGQITHFKSATDSAGAADRATLTTGADGTATLTAVVCTAGIEVVAWSTAAGTVSGTAATMVAQAATSPSKASDGTTTYCTTPVNQDGVYQAVTSVDEITTITPSQADTAAGATTTFTICNEAQSGHQLNPSLTAGLTGAPLCVETGTVACAANMAAAMQTAFRNTSNVDAATTAVAVGGGTSYTVTFPVNTGSWTIATGTNGCIDGSSNATTFAYTATTTNGAALEEWLYIDNDPTANTILVEVNTESTSTAGAAVAAAKSYHVITYDSTDVFMVDATDGAITTAIDAATEAQFEATMAALDVLTTEISGTEREAATGSGVSFWTIGK